MKLRLVLLLLLCMDLAAIETSDNLFECSKIFQERKSELLVELERIDEQRQALEALKTATDALLLQKEVRLQERENNVSTVLKEISQKEANIKKMLEKNEKLLDEIKTLKMDKTSQTFAKMKAGSAAQILEKMSVEEAAAVMMTLKPKIVGQILAKMEAKKASEISLRIASMSSVETKAQ